jgi:hypothetical protein
MFDLRLNQTVQLFIAGTRPGALAYHAMIAVYPHCYYRHPDFGIYYNPPVYQIGTAPKYMIADSGIYLFGGMNGHKVVTNRLYVLKTGHKRFSWRRITAGGVTPPARYKHIMVYTQKLNGVVICGGVGENEAPLNDIWILNLDKITWVHVSVGGTTMPAFLGLSAG